ncbi:hypothetical protein [Pectobacterium aquaticum]|uniref:hypothetical protein n=1 Tax=Pectobacterium aquaticum TaxID=2204145 RepID=UPI001F0D9049|nr:hypothetical protein [Pectobacterium aquaticum]MCH5049397.1 hypothetical protein [Pectobacterium aquaticum]
MRVLIKLLKFLLKSGVLFILFVGTVGFWADKNVSPSVRMVFAPIFSVGFLFFFWRWFVSVMLKKRKDILEHTTPTPTPTIASSSTQNSNAENASIEHDFFNMVNGEATVWVGETKLASFRLFSETERTQGIFVKLAIREDGEFYLDLMNAETGEINTFREKDINSKIIVGSTRYDFVELCKKIFKLDLSEVFEYAKLIRKNAAEPKTINTFDPISTTFTYSSSNGTNRRTVDVDRYLRNGYGEDYIEGFCHMRGERRMFSIRNIKTMLSSDGYKKYHFHDWLKNVAKIDQNAS